MTWDRLTPAEQRRIQIEKLHHYFYRRHRPVRPYYKKLFAEHKIDPRPIKTVAGFAPASVHEQADLLPTQNSPKIP